MARQLAFDLPANVRLEAQDFFVSSANELAYALLQTPSTWPDTKLALIGPAGSGKTPPRTGLCVPHWRDRS